MTEKYNGWTNRATWLDNVWGNPESRDDLDMLKADLEEQYDALPNGILKDMLDFGEINWEELAEHFDEEEEDENGPDEEGLDYSPSGSGRRSDD